MRLGSSMRRRRGGGRKSSSKTGGQARKRLAGWIRGLSRSMPTLSPGLLWGLGVFAVLGFAGGYFFSTKLLYPTPPPPGDLMTVPDLAGVAPEAAVDTLETLGLALGSVDSLRHPTVPAGMIVGQDPLPGQLSLVGDSVWVAVSAGPAQRPVPDVRMLLSERARIVLETAGFTVVEDSVRSETPRGTVVAMSPEPGTDAVIPAEVSLMVSRGPPLVEMPSVMGLEEERAVELLDSLGFVVGDVETRFRFGRDQGLVVEQDPPAAAMVQEGATVRLVVGRRGG